MGLWGKAAVMVYCAVAVCVTALDTQTPASSIHNMDILMKSAKPEKPDAYLCTSYDVEEEEAYIVKFEALANADTAHHILMYGCEHGAYSSSNIWGCPPICRGGPQQIMFAWAKNAPPTQLPDGVGLRIGKRTSIRTIVMQIHYAKSFQPDESPDKSGIRLHVTSQRQPYVAGIFLMLSYSFTVPPHQPKYHVDMSCSYKKDHSMFPFAYRTHAHGLGSVITGYQYNDTGYHLIGKGNPQWPQAFYPAKDKIEVKPEDKLVARCTYNSTRSDHRVHVGATGEDEMCNFYIMFYTNASVETPAGQCGGVEFEDLVDNLPAGSDVTLPPNPLLDEQAHGHHHHHSMPHASSTTEHHHSEPTVAADPLTSELQYQANWPGNDPDIGQVGGLATDNDGNVYIFHRGDRSWDHTSFDMHRDFTKQDQPITQNTILILGPDGVFIRKFGAGRFFMPHGIEVDHDGNIWLTDVALHQVLRIPADSEEADLTLGERFVHGDDHSHFCQPSDVAVLSSGEFFVSDGYCNSRIMKFSKDGQFLKQWGRANDVGNLAPAPGQFFIPHCLTVVPSLRLVCVADRENGRIQCFDLDGNFQFLIKDPQFGPSVYAVKYSPRHGGLLYAVNGEGWGSSENVKVQGFTFSMLNHSRLETWNLPSPRGLSRPHDLAVDALGQAVYVGELDPHSVIKFQRHTSIEAFLPNIDPDSTPTSSTSDMRDLVTPAVQYDDNINPIDKGEGPETPVMTGTPVNNVIVREEEKEKEVSFFTPIILVGVLLCIPLVGFLIFILVGMYKGWNTCCGPAQTETSFSRSSHKGFDRLLQDDTDSESDLEFTLPITNKK